MKKPKGDEWLAEKREEMITRQLKARGISSEKILAAFRKVKREMFLPLVLHEKAYEDHPLPIGFDQTISQPYIVAIMTESLELNQGDRVLEVGTGSGYQTAILAELVGEVYTVEIISELFEAAKLRLNALGYRNVHMRHADGRNGWVDAAPFDKIIVTAGTEQIPDPLVAQLKEGGKMIIPLGYGDQDLVLGRKEKGVLITKQLIPVRFVPLRSGSL